MVVSERGRGFRRFDHSSPDLHAGSVNTAQSELHVATQTQRGHERSLVNEMEVSNSLRSALGELQRADTVDAAARVWRPAVVAHFHRVVLEQVGSPPPPHHHL